MSYPIPIADNATFRRASYMVLVAVVLLFWLLPLLAVLATSFRGVGDIMAGNYWGWPKSPSPIGNYADVFLKTSMWRYLANGFAIVVPTVLAVLVLSTCTGYVLSSFAFPGATVLFAVFVGGNFLPHQIMMIPVRDLMVRTGLFDTYFALIIFHTAFQTGFSTLFMRGFIAALPRELFQAAKSEGASPFQILWHVVVPLLRPALAALAVLTFTFVWNDYFWAIVLTQSDTVKPVTAGLANLKGEWVSAWNIVSAGTIVVALPPLIMFLAMQKHFIAGLTMGAVKG